ncbi:MULTISPECIES: hypothetical protein [Nostocales]|uniref:hypothetical protein n=1 Tax=Nostocales TaxID=1161 RepID=UPI001684C762|nr:MULTISPECIES: hypothetical protein [Nostocales]MBD2487345.1 hypothetical protein [Aulosira sp. FACHB-615]
MSKRKMAAGVLFPLLLLESVFIAPVNALNAKKLYQLCSSFPLNSRCQGYEVPISLDDRSGKKGDCILNKNDLEKRGNCKVNVNEIGVTIYQEMGEKLEIINDKKSTQIIQISPKEISRIEYREDEKDNTDARVVNTLLFGITGFLLTPNKKISEIQINYASATPEDTSQEQRSMDYLRIFVGRGTGREMRSQLEKITGLQAETPQATKLAN